MRICIIGGPKTGKSTLARQLGTELGTTVKCTDPKSMGGDADDRLDLPQCERWSAISEDVSHWLDEPGPWIIEGVALVRALRKWRARNPGQPPPCDRLLVLSLKRARTTPQQDAMSKGVHTVFRELVVWLHDVIEAAR